MNGAIEYQVAFLRAADYVDPDPEWIVVRANGPADAIVAFNSAVDAQVGEYPDEVYGVRVQFQQNHKEYRVTNVVWPEPQPQVAVEVL